MEVVLGKHAVQSHEGLLLGVRWRHRSHHRPGEVFWLRLVGLPGKALTRDATGILWFDVHAADWLHSMVFYGYSVIAL